MRVNWYKFPLYWILYHIAFSEATNFIPFGPKQMMFRPSHTKVIGWKFTRQSEIGADVTKQEIGSYFSNTLMYRQQTLLLGHHNMCFAR